MMYASLDAIYGERIANHFINKGENLKNSLDTFQMIAQAKLQKEERKRQKKWNKFVLKLTRCEVLLNIIRLADCSEDKGEEIFLIVARFLFM